MSLQPATFPISTRRAPRPDAGKPVAFTHYESLKGRTVVVTGGASGIGAAFVRAFAANQSRVAFLDVQADAGAALADAVGREAGASLFVPCDLTDVAALRTSLDTVREALG